jgi:beta-glucosidase
MTVQHRLRFPEGFLWGTASSAYQCEGGNTNNQWYRWERQGRILSGEACGAACGWWEHAEDDFDLAEQMENNALRLSLEWGRVEPAEGRWDGAALERYRTMLVDLRRRRIKPVVTLHHFTEPLWFVDRGGFSREQNVRFFVRYARRVVAALKDLCDFWLTINEPNVYVAQGYATGDFPPGERNLLKAALVLRNLLQAHVEAFYAISDLQPESQIGCCIHYRVFDPALPFSLLDRGAAAMQDTFFNRAAMQAFESGRFIRPLNMLLAPVPHAAATRDYHGVNYYTRDMVRFSPTRSSELFGRRFVRAGAVRNDAGLDNSFGEIYPAGMYRVLQKVYTGTRGNKPIYVTENGFSDGDDSRRPRAILEHLALIHRAIGDGIPVRGYLHWSLADNFEWNNGWTARFGLVEVNPATQQRAPRPSASMFGEICRANAITEAIVERYAPQALEFIFGEHARRRGRVAVP